MAANYKILLVEDDLNFGAVLKDYLELNDFDVTLCKDGLQGAAGFSKGQFDICILDVMMPYKDGFTLAREIKKTNGNMPLIFLTAKAQKDDQLQGFKLGADDYITKPFDSEVLLYKIKAILKRHENTNPPDNQQNKFTLGTSVFDYSLRSVTANNQVHKLSPKEAELLKLLCQIQNQVLAREVALRTIWKEDSYFTARSMDVYITKLRKYFQHDASVTIENIHGNGFCLKVK
ncbi:MAG: response regulator transcription factor [Moraxellaceae bacterium]|nr:MAG: response regulator transcription factor [Moraxellaceae bacterium]